MLGLRLVTETMALDGGTGTGRSSGGGGTSSGGGSDRPWWDFTGRGREHVARQQDAAYRSILDALPPNVRQNGIQIDEFHWVDPATGTVYELGRGTDGSPKFTMLSDADSKRFLASVGGGGTASGGGGGSSGGGAATDERYWDLQYRQLEAQYRNMGLDAESARRQALASLIANRNNTAVDVGNLSLQAAKQAAEFAANPRDAVAELMYRNQVGGSTPFGDMTSKHFGAYGKALAEKAESIFSPVQKDLGLAREYARSIPPVEFFGPEIRQQLGLGLSPAQSLAAGGTPSAGPSLPATGAAPAPDAAALQFWARGAEQAGGMDKFAEGLKRLGEVPKYDEGGTIDFGPIYANRDKPGYSPASSEGGTSLNLHERAVVVGESGHIYATLGERREDGTMRAEQLVIKPLPSEVKKDKALEDAKKKKVETQQQFLSSFAEGGTVNATPDDFMEQLSKLLGSYGGSGGGTGAYSTPLPSLRLLAGAPANALEDDPVLADYAMAGYSALGIDPRTVASTIKKYTPASAQLTGQTRPRVNFL